MGFYIEFKQADSERDIVRAVNFISKLHLGYQNYDDWVQKAEAELLTGYKKAILAFSDRRIVGDLIYQPHKNIQGVLELKNLRVHEGLRKRDFGHFMLKQVISKARKSGYLAILANARATQQDVIGLLMFSGFFQINKLSLYDSNEEEVVMMNPLLKDNNLIQIVNSFFGV